MNLYHVSLKSNLESILEKGLLLGSERSSDDYHDEFVNGIYFLVDPYNIHDFLSEFMNKDIVIFQVNLPDSYELIIDKECLSDEFMEDESICNSLYPDESNKIHIPSWIYKGDISPEYIKLLSVVDNLDYDSELI